MQTSGYGIRLAAQLPKRIATRVQLLLASAPDPAAVVHFLERLRHSSVSAFERICNSPAALRCAVNVFSHSKFLSEAVLKNPERILQVASSGSLYRVLTAEEYDIRLFDVLGAGLQGVPSA